MTLLIIFLAKMNIEITIILLSSKWYNSHLPPPPTPTSEGNVDSVVTVVDMYYINNYYSYIPPQVTYGTQWITRRAAAHLSPLFSRSNLSFKTMRRKVTHKPKILYLARWDDRTKHWLSKEGMSTPLTDPSLFIIM